MSHGHDLIEIRRARLDEPVKIVLPSRGAAGYEWQLAFDEADLKLVRRRRLSGGQSFGAAGKEQFWIRALKPGRHALRFDLVRPQGGTSAERREYEIRVED